MAAKAALLRLARRVVVVVIQAGFAKRHDSGVPGGRYQIGRSYVELFMGVVRMGANRAEDIGEALGDGEELRLTSDARGNRDHALDPCGARARDHGVKLRGKIGKIEMAMAVDEHVFFLLLGRAAFRLDITRKDRSRRRQVSASGDAVLAAEKRERPLIRGNRQKIEQLCG